jgi:hypothetical protein
MLLFLPVTSDTFRNHCQLAWSEGRFKILTHARKTNTANIMLSRVPSEWFSSFGEVTLPNLGISVFLVTGLNVSG